jgi:CubicO group peptidase (beta-lactamase class C family)
MDIKALVFLLLSVLLTTIGCSQFSNPINSQNFDGENITSEDAQLIFDHTKSFPPNTHLSFAFIKKGTVHFYGIKRSGDQIQTVDNHENTFEIGSISKVFTSTLLADMALNDSLDVSSSIDNHLDLTLKDEHKISLLSLSNHTSGLPRLPSNLNVFGNTANPYKTYDGEKLMNYLNEELSLSESKGTKSAYSNLGAGLLGYTLAKIKNQSYEELLQEKVLKPLSMKSTSSQRKNVESKLVKGLDKNGKEVSNWDFDALAGAGAIISTVDDLSKFALSQMDTSNPVALLSQKKTYKVNDNMDVAMGWHIIKGKNGEILHWHNGGTGGYTSSMAIDNKKKNGIIILSNVSAFSSKMGNIDKLVFALMKNMD